MSTPAKVSLLARVLRTTIVGKRRSCSSLADRHHLCEQVARAGPRRTVSIPESTVTASTLPEASELGQWRMRHGPNRANAKVVLFVSFASALTGLFFLLLGLGGSHMSDKLTFSGVGAFTMLLRVGCFLTYRGQLKMMAVAYADAFVFANWRGQNSVFLWDDVTEVYQSVNHFNSGSGPASWTYAVYQRNGQDVKLNSAIQDLAPLGHTVQVETRGGLLSRAARVYRAGGTVAFRPKIGLNRQGLVSGQKTLD